MTSYTYELRQTLLKLSGVNVSYDGVPILRDMELEVKNIVRPGMDQGQVVALVGPSGMGKTTLFRVLAGLMKPDSGEVLVGEELRPVERGMVGVVAQNYPLFAHRTVRGNLLVAGKQGGLGGDALTGKADSLLKQFGIADQGSKYPAQLSGGQRQRVAIAQQFMCSEHFLLMDEPFSGLDLLAKERVIQFISDMAQTHELKTFIVVTHDISAALEVADTLWILGRDRDAKGEPVPGARVKASFNLIERGLAWRDGISSTPEYLQLRSEVRDLFPKL